jgi:hypothetical protein
MQRCRVRIFCNKTHPIHAMGPQTHILGRSGPFRYCTNFGANQADLGSLMHKFIQRCRVGLFFATNAPDPAYWSLDSCFAASGTVPLLHELRCKSCRTGVINAQVRPTISLWQNQFELHRLKYASPPKRASACFKRYNPLACRVTSR